MTEESLHTKALEHLEKGEIEKGLYLLENSSKQGETESTFKLAEINWHGLYETVRSFSTAWNYYEKCIEDGYEPAKIKIAHWLLSTNEIKDEKRTIQLLSSCASSDSLALKGYLYYMGRSIECDHKKAFTMITDAAKQKSLLAIGFLAEFYHSGHGTTKNHKLRDQLLIEALKSNQVQAIFFATSVLLEEGQLDDETRYGMTSDKLLELGMSQFSLDCWERWLVTSLTKLDASARLESVKEWTELSPGFAALAYIDYISVMTTIDEPRVEQERVPCYEFMKSAIQAGSGSCMLRIGRSMREGELGLTSDPKREIELFKKAIEMGEVDAWVDIGNFYMQGIVYKQSDEKALECYLKSYPGESSVEMIADYYGDREDWDNAIKWYKKGAKWSNPYCIVNIGTILLINKEDCEGSLKWFKMAWALNPLENGLYLVYMESLREMEDGDEIKRCTEEILALDPYDPDIINEIGLLYDGGHGYAQDHDKAMEFFLKAAEMCSQQAMFNCGRGYQSGDMKSGVDMKKAIHYYRQALGECDEMDELMLGGHEEPDLNAADELGEIYFRGKGVKMDYDSALKYLERAVEGEVADAFLSYYELLIKLGRKDDALKLIHKRMRDEGDVRSFYDYGCLSLRGIIKLNPKELQETFKKAVDGGIEEARFHYAFATESVDIEMAKKHYLEFIDEDHEDEGNARANLGDIYYDEEKYDDSFAMYTKALEIDPKSGQGIIGLGLCYFYGRGVEKDEKQAKSLHLQAKQMCENGIKSCISEDDAFEVDSDYFYLGKIYEHGCCVEKDLEKALYYYKESARRHFEAAVKRLDELKMERTDIGEKIQ